MIEKEILHVLNLELSNEFDKNSERIIVLLSEENSDEIKSKNYNELLEFINCISDAGDIVEFHEFTQLCTFFLVNLKAVKSEYYNHEKWLELGPFALSWLKDLQDCLDQPDNIELLGKLCVSCENKIWPQPMVDTIAEELAENLFVALTSSGEEGKSTDGKLDINIDELSFEFSRDVNLKLIDAFYVEVPEQVLNLSVLVQSLSIGDLELKKLQEAQRMAHSIKGTANIVGLTSAATITHLIEDVLDYLVDKKVGVNAALGELLLNCVDHLEEIISSICGNGGMPNDTYDLLLKLNDWESVISSGEMPSLTLQIEEDIESKIDSDKVVNTANDNKATIAQTIDSVIRVSVKSMNLLTRLAGELSTSLVQVEGVMLNTLNQTKLLDSHSELVNRRLSKLQDLIEHKNVSVKKTISNSENNQSELDPLEMDEYNELHSASNSLAETLRDVLAFNSIINTSLKSMHEMQYQMDDLSSEINDTLMSTRLTSINSISQRLHRGVRQVSKDIGKSVQLTILGADIMIDNDILDSITDPLLHVLRNAIDHGIENTKDRLDADKPEIGQIILTYQRQGESLVIDCQDDGRGFNIDQIRKKAIDSKLLHGDANLTDKEWLAITLVSGFTTRDKDEVTQVSGRGIGMDVVNRTIEGLRGSVEINSQDGLGSHITLRMPLTLISMHLLLFRLESSIFATPSSSLEQVLFSDAGNIIKKEIGHSFILNEEIYEIYYMQTLLGLMINKELDFSIPVPLLLVKTNNGNAAIIIDEALNGRNLVVNRFNNFVPRVIGTIGASILGDGSIAPVLDLIDLLRRPQGNELFTTQIPIELESVIAQKILVVDDSISARGSMVDTLHNAGFITLVAVDGLDALSVLENNEIDAIILDLEMPRMNGLELAIHLRSLTQYHELPLIMVTSRSTAKHKELARKAGINTYFTKPYQEIEFLDKIIELTQTF